MSRPAHTKQKSFLSIKADGGGGGTGPTARKVSSIGKAGSFCFAVVEAEVPAKPEKIPPGQWLTLATLLDWAE